MGFKYVFPAVCIYCIFTLPEVLIKTSPRSPAQTPERLAGRWLSGHEHTHFPCANTPSPRSRKQFGCVQACFTLFEHMHIDTHTNMLRHTLAPLHACFPWQLCFFCLQHVRRLFGLINAAPRRRWSLTGSTCILPCVISPSPLYSCNDKQRYKRISPPIKKTYLDSLGFNGFVNSVMKKRGPLGVAARVLKMVSVPQAKMLMRRVVVDAFCYEITVPVQMTSYQAGVGLSDICVGSEAFVWGMWDNMRPTSAKVWFVKQDYWKTTSLIIFLILSKRCNSTDSSWKASNINLNQQQNLNKTFRRYDVCALRTEVLTAAAMLTQ